MRAAWTLARGSAAPPPWWASVGGKTLYPQLGIMPTRSDGACPSTDRLVLDGDMPGASTSPSGAGR
jgi:hypothetical protein